MPFPASQQNGTTAALTLATDTQLGTDITTAGTYEVQVDTTNLANGEALILIVKQKVLTGGVVRQVDRFVVAMHAQGSVLKRSIPYVSLYSLQFFLRQEGGTGRAYDWNIVQLQ